MFAKEFFTISRDLFHDTLTRRVSHCVNFTRRPPMYGHSEKDQVRSPEHRALKTPQISKTPYSSWKSDVFQRFSCDSARESQGVLRHRIGPQWALKTLHLATWNRRICRRFQSFTKFSAGCSLYRSNVRSFLPLWINWREFSWHAFSTVRVCMTWENTKDVLYWSNIYGSIALFYNGLWCGVC